LIAAVLIKRLKSKKARIGRHFGHNKGLVKTIGLVQLDMLKRMKWRLKLSIRNDLIIKRQPKLTYVVGKKTDMK